MATKPMFLAKKGAAPFKPCSSCKMPAKCKTAGKCLAKGK